MENNIELNDRIIKYLEEAVSPMTLESISQDFLITNSDARRALDELESGNRVAKIIPNTGSERIYYTINEPVNHKIQEKIISPDLHLEFAQETVNVKDSYTELSEKIGQINENVNSIYVNIISIMSIFVAIFALITVNANIVFTVSKENMKDIFWGIIFMNIFVVICILILLLGVKKIIINGIIKK